MSNKVADGKAGNLEMRGRLLRQMDAFESDDVNFSGQLIVSYRKGEFMECAHTPVKAFSKNKT